MACGYREGWCVQVEAYSRQYEVRVDQEQIQSARVDARKRTDAYVEQISASLGKPTNAAHHYSRVVSPTAGHMSGPRPDDGWGMIRAELKDMMMRVLAASARRLSRIEQPSPWRLPKSTRPCAADRARCEATARANVKAPHYVGRNHRLRALKVLGSTHKRGGYTQPTTYDFGGSGS